MRDFSIKKTVQLFCTIDIKMLLSAAILLIQTTEMFCSLTAWAGLSSTNFQATATSTMKPDLELQPDVGRGMEEVVEGEDVLVVDVELEHAEVEVVGVEVVVEGGVLGYSDFSVCLFINNII